MNLDANVQKILTLILKKWKPIILVALVGALLAGIYTANFTTLTYSSTVEFLAYAQDSRQDINDATKVAQASSNTSKMNYAINMLDTYIEMFKTNKFNQAVADDLNKKYNATYSASYIQSSIVITKVSNTAMFKIAVTTDNADRSYQIAKQLEKSIPEKMLDTNNGVVNASIEDSAIKASASESLGYPKKCLIGFAAGAALAVVFIILRDLLDVRIRTAEELSERYGIPVLGTIPEFDLKSGQAKSSSKQKSPAKVKKGE
ncbi:MAG: Wzz/FepE/Etk N-terminal domain-containing protein [Acetobacter sp.]|nr:Wzz/FepE/Etk N-terminal domain-containing protein [Bacteroides sp.]MCM1340189.1 Wzz/FepE/Etk N-terminal domain-containing protein [Acetobacter sp.]MCM1432859.1 Wzz/FepE/Etk N-terminal domain-containing protein [Clostridiales bacterium]